MSEEFVYKPSSEKNGNLVVLTPASYGGKINQVYLVDANGNIVDKGQYSNNTNGNRPTFRFSKPGSAYGQGIKTVVVMDDGSAVTYDTSNGGKRYAGISGQQGRAADINPQLASGSMDIASIGTATVGGSSYMYPQIDYSTFDIPELPYTQIQDIDQVGIAGEVGQFNIGQQQQAFQIGKQQAGELLDLEIQGLRDYVTQARQLRQEGAIDENQFNQAQIAAANKFNQLQRLQAADVAVPEARDFISEGIERNKQLAQGVIPDTVQDRAFEMASRSTSADMIAAGGFGAGSVVGQKTSDLLSAQQRLTLSQQGEAGGQNFIRLGMDLNFDQPIKYNPILSTTSQSITGQPSVSPMQAAAAQTSQLTQLSTISPQAAIGVEANRALQQASLDRQADIFNVQSATTEQLTQLNAALFNVQQEVGSTNLASDLENTKAEFQTALEAGDDARMTELITALGTKYGGSVLSGIYNEVKGWFANEKEGTSFLQSLFGGEEGTSNYGYTDVETGASVYYEDQATTDISSDIAESNYTNSDYGYTDIETGEEVSLKKLTSTKQYTLSDGTKVNAVTKNGELAITSIAPVNTEQTVKLKDGTLGYMLNDGSVVLDADSLSKKKNQIVGKKATESQRTTANVVNSLGTLANPNASTSDQVAASASIIGAAGFESFSGTIENPTSISGSPVVEETKDGFLTADGREVSKGDLQASATFSAGINAYKLLMSNASREQKMVALAQIGVTGARATEAINAANAGNANAALAIISTAINWDKQSDFGRAVGAVQAGSAVISTAGSQATEGSTFATAGEYAGYTGSALTLAAATYQTYQNYQAAQEMPRSQSQTDIVASQTATGIGAGSAINFGWGSLIGGVIGLASGLIMANTGTGKGSGQAQRDNWRQMLEKAGAVNNPEGTSQFLLPLADGSQYDIGLDGNNKLQNKNGTERHTYDIDWSDTVATNSIPLAHLFVIASGLDPTTNEGKDLFHRTTSQVVNAATSNTDNIEGAAANIRTMLNNTGVDPMQLAMRIEVLRTQNKISDQEYTTYISKINELYGTNFSTTDTKQARSSIVNALQYQIADFEANKEQLKGTESWDIAKNAYKANKDLLEELTNEKQLASWERARRKRSGEQVQETRKPYRISKQREEKLRETGVLD